MKDNDLKILRVFKENELRLAIDTNAKQSFEKAMQFISIENEN